MAQTHDELQAEYDLLTSQLSDLAAAGDPAELARVGKRHTELSELLTYYAAAERASQQIGELEAILADESDSGMRQLAEEDLLKQRQALDLATTALNERLRPRDPHDAGNAIIELRAGAGGDESSLFAAELYAMYQRYGEAQGWQADVYNRSTSEAGGLKEIIFQMKGAGVYGRLKHEGGTHRVQRVPATESQGRIHTSTVTVAVLPEVPESEVNLKPEELRIDVFRSSGPGGQSVNTTDSAVRITHLPTGLTATSQDEKSQHKNRAKALSILRARLAAQQAAEAAATRGDARREQVGTGERSEKIRTYNFPQDRLTDHRVGYSSHGLDKILSGHLDTLLEAVDRGLMNDADGR